MNTKSILLFLILLTFSLSSIGQALSSEWNFNEFETWLRDHQRTISEVETGSQLLAERYEVEGRVQEAIWTYRLGGHTERANLLEENLRENLSSRTMTFIENLDGADGSKKFRIGSGELFGVFKATNSHYTKEVAAYRIDSLLELNIVPTTVVRNHTEHGVGSLQYFVRDASINSGWGEDSVEFRRTGYPRAQKSMWLLDFLLDNQDRHGWNWLKRFGEVPVAIDHGRTLGSKGTGKAKMQEELLPEGKVLERLFDMRPEHFDDLNLDTSPIFERRDQILDQIEKRKPGLHCRMLLAS